ncbi:DUF397 domain-containing protein [Sphaerisporangium album]|uniref:DUF397 domain-containing protein n=1 Tax=Sphaerisporangium album TaxID=509200 RepID=A0A367FR68_9ACTN|nr:DUF397 domain-containing protein [Sphaerisporangium album]
MVPGRVPVRVDERLLVLFDGERVLVRDEAGAGEEPGTVVRYTRAEWCAFVEGVRHEGEFGLDWLLGRPSSTETR